MLIATEMYLRADLAERATRIRAGWRPLRARRGPAPATVTDAAPAGVRWTHRLAF